MSRVIKIASGIDWIQAGAVEGVGPIRSLPGPNAGGPVIYVTIRADRLNIPPGPTFIVLAPNTGGTNGTDNFSNYDPDNGTYSVGVTVGLGYDGSAAHPYRWISSTGFIDFDGDMLDSYISAYTNHAADAGLFRFEIWLDYKDPTNPEDWFNPGPSTGPQNIDHTESDTLDEFDELTGDKDQTFTWDIPLDPLVGTIIQRDGETIAVLGLDPLGDPILTYTDTVIPGNTYEYTFFHYYLDGAGVSEPVVYPPVIVGGDPVVIPLISVTMVGGIYFGGAPSIGMIINPSGIYGLIPNLTHDVLYERIPTITSVNVKIPDPFAKLIVSTEN